MVQLESISEGVEPYSIIQHRGRERKEKNGATEPCYWYMDWFIHIILYLYTVNVFILIFFFTFLLIKPILNREKRIHTKTVLASIEDKLGRQFRNVCMNIYMRIIWLVLLRASSNSRA